VEAGALDPGPPTHGGFEPDWDAVLAGLAPATRWLEGVFRR